MWENEMRYDITIANDLPKHCDVGCVLAFHHYKYILWGQSRQWLFYKFIIWPKQNLFSSEKNQGMFSWRGCLSLLKSFAVWSFLLSFIVWDKNWSWMSSCTTCLIRNSDTFMYLTLDLIPSLGSLRIMAWISSTNSRVLFLSKQSD